MVPSPGVRSEWPGATPLANLPPGGGPPDPPPEPSQQGECHHQLKDTPQPGSRSCSPQGPISAQTPLLHCALATKWAAGHRGPAATLPLPQELISLPWEMLDSHTPTVQKGTAAPRQTWAGA